MQAGLPGPARRWATTSGLLDFCEMTLKQKGTNTIPKKRLSFWVFLALWVFLLCFALTEVMLRAAFEREEVNWNYWGPGAFEQSELVGFHHTPGYTGRAYRRGIFDCPVRISKYGLRQKDVDTQIKYPSRLLILGDSFAFGLGVEEHQAFPYLIHESLNPLGIGVINAGQTGYCPEQETLLASKEIEEFNPRMVVLFLFLGNDVEGDFLHDYRNIEVRYGYRLPKDRWLPWRPFDFLRTHLYIFLFVDGRLNERRTARIHHDFETIAKQDPKEAMKPTLDALRGFQNLCDSRGIRFGVVIIPPGTAGMSFYHPLKRALQATKIPYLDLQEKNFRPRDRFRVDNHWNKSGHRKVAEYLVPFVRELNEGS